MLRAWHLAILRFAVTRDDSDRLNVLAIATEMDRLGGKGNEGAFRFFRNTSSELCSAICGPNEADVLRRYLAQVDDARFKRAFAAVTAIEQTDAMSIGRHHKRDAKLWRGLPARRSQAPL